MNLPYNVSPVCPECEKGYLSHREYLEDDYRSFYGGKSRLVFMVHRDFCSNPFCNYDHKTRSIHLG